MISYRGLRYTSLLLGITLVPFPTAGAVSYEKCLKDLYEADADEDFKLTRAEYMKFIAKRSDGSIDVSAYEDLPLPLIANFNFAACMCSQYGIGTPGCCVGERAKIDLDPSHSQMVISDSLYTFCYHIDLIIGGYETPPPTPVSTTVPSFMPSMSPSMKPTGASRASNSPSSSPSNKSSLTPSATPSSARSPIPTVTDSENTQSPTVDPFACFIFQYAIVNNAGLDADHLYYERNNTLKTGLELATRSIIERAFNATYTRDEDSPRSLLESRAKISKSPSPKGPLQKNLGEIGVQGCVSVGRINKYQLVSRVDTVGRRRLPSNGKNEIGSVEITAIIQNRFCAEEGPNVRCAIVSTRVCARMGASDEKIKLKQIILDPIEDAITNGDFEDSIPPEHKLPNS